MRFPFLFSALADTYGSSLFMILVLVLTGAAFVGTLFLVGWGALACARGLKSYSYDWHLPRVVYSSEAVMIRGRMLRKGAKNTVKILENARRMHVELGDLPTGASDATNAADVFEVKIKTWFRCESY
jgi:hypothetical protein